MTSRVSETISEVSRAPSLPSARAEYARRLADRKATLDRQTKRDHQIADIRLIVFVIALILLMAALITGKIGWYWSLVPLVGFVALLVVHDRVRVTTRKMARSVNYYEKGLKRIDGEWPGSGTTGDRFSSPDHPYAADLDLFGVGSLFERICTARTRTGEETLASWLLAPAEASTIYDRHAAITELRPELDLREDLELIGVEVREGIDPEKLASWGKQPPVYTSQWPSVIAWLLAVAAVGTIVSWVITGSVLPFLAVVLLETAFTYWQAPRMKSVTDPLQRRTHDLVLLAELLERLERERFDCPASSDSAKCLQTEGEPASRRVARLARLVALLEAKNNQAFTIFAYVLLWSNHFSAAIDSWRTHTGPAIADWLRVVGEFEALGSIAAYSYENPLDPFPEIEPTETSFEGEAVGHPLIASAVCIRNDVHLGGPLRVMLVSGSNMSGKSTLLRTVGTNIVLALAGAPVHARRVRVSVLSIGATLRIQDSLQAGKSRFYAEVSRIKQLVRPRAWSTTVVFSAR